MKMLKYLGITYVRNNRVHIVWINPLTWIAYLILLILAVLSSLGLFDIVVDDDEIL